MSHSSPPPSELPRQASAAVNPEGLVEGILETIRAILQRLHSHAPGLMQILAPIHFLGHKLLGGVEFMSVS